MTRRNLLGVLGVLGVPVAAGVAGLVAATAKGLYVSPDAVFYVGTARNLVDGRGFTPSPGLPPLQHFPPLFTLVLAAIAKIGPDPLTAARVVNVVAFAGIVVLVGLVVRFRTGSVAAALVASVLTACAVDLLTYSASALSEPFFVLLALGALVALAAHLDRPRPPLLLLAAGLAGAAFLTRYVGVALVLAGVIALLWRRRWLDAPVFGAVALAPVAAWLLLADGPSDRTVSWHPFGWEYLGQAGRPFSRWLVPWPHPPVALLVAVALVVAGVVLARGGAAPSSLNPLLALFTVAYLAVLLANRALTDATGRLDARFLVPLHIVAILVAVPALHRPKLPAPALALAAVLVLAQLADAAAWTAGGLTDEGVGRRGYNAAALRRSPVLTLPGQPVYSNAPDALFFLTGETAVPIPAKKDYLTGKANTHYAEELAAMREGLLLYVDVAFRRSFQPSRADLEAALPLRVVADDGVVTAYRLG